MDKIKNILSNIAHKLAILIKKSKKNLSVKIKHVKEPKNLMIIFTFILVYTSIYSIRMATYQVNLNRVELSKSNFLNLIASNNLESALRIYRDASTIELINKPNPFYLFSWWGKNHSRPNENYLWRLMKGKLNQHASNYIYEGFLPQVAGGRRGGRISGGGSPDKYLGINLAYSDLRGTKLSGFDFTLVDLYRADLRGADLRGCDFSNAFLLETDLRGCNLGMFDGENSKTTIFEISKDNKKLFDKVKDQFYKRLKKDIKNGRRFLVDSNQINIWCENLESEDFKIRYQSLCAISQLTDEQRTNRVRNSLIALLKNEITTTIRGEVNFTISINPPKNCSTDIHSDNRRKYFYKLLIATLKLKGNPCLDKIVWFVSSPYVNKSKMRNELSKIGISVINPLKEIIIEGTPKMKKFAVRILSKIVNKKTPISDSIKSEITNCLIKTLKDNRNPKDRDKEWKEHKKEYVKFRPGEIPNSTKKWFTIRKEEKFLIRKFTIEALVKVKDTTSLPILRELAETDSYKNMNRDNKIQYPIRNKAREAINSISRR